MSDTVSGPLPVVSQDSTQAGFLRPSGTAPDYLEDDALDDFLQQLVVGITGLPAPFVRPLWQPEPTNLPDWGTTWAAVGLVESELVSGWSYETHDPANTGTDKYTSWEYATFLVTFYGPLAATYDGLFRDGLFIRQNQEILLANGIGLVDWNRRAVVPELIKERWWRRVDRHVRILREINRTYNVRNIKEVLVSVAEESPTGTPPDQDRSLTVTPPGIT